MARHRSHIYRSSWHLFATFLVIIVPFAFLLGLSFATGFRHGNLVSALLLSSGRMLIAYLLSAILGVAMALLFYRGPLSLVALPIFDVLQCFPTSAALPLFVAWRGASNLTVIFFLTLAIIWPIFFSIISSLKRINQDWQDAVAIAHLSKWDYFRKFLWPVTVPGLITGSIIGLGDGWEALVATEIIVRIPHGLGNFFQGVTNNQVITGLGIFGVLLFIFSINKLIWLPLLERSHHIVGE